MAISISSSSQRPARGAARRNSRFSTGGFVLVIDYVRMEVTLVGSSNSKNLKKNGRYENVNGAGGGGTAGSFDLTSLPSLATLTYMACGANFK